MCSGVVFTLVHEASDPWFNLWHIFYLFFLLFVLFFLPQLKIISSCIQCMVASLIEMWGFEKCTGLTGLKCVTKVHCEHKISKSMLFNSLQNESMPSRSICVCVCMCVCMYVTLAREHDNWKTQGRVLLILGWWNTHS